MERADCEALRNNPLKNPRTRRTLKPGGPVQTTLIKNCKDAYGIVVQAAAPTQAAPGKLTTAQCEAFRKEPTRNPLTGRKLIIGARYGLYTTFLQECGLALENLAKLQSRPVADEDDVYKLHRIRLQFALRRALRPILHTKDSLQDRVAYQAIVKSYFSHLQPCLVAPADGERKWVMLEAPKTKSAVPQERLIFDKRIGSESVYGMAYLNMGKGMGRLLKLSAKVMPSDFADEVSVLKRMSALGERHVSPNVPILYHSFECGGAALNAALKRPTNRMAVPDIMKNSYLVVLSELADGDLHAFFKDTHPEDVYESVIFQVCLALRVFHSQLGLIHNDAHMGNFLFHRVKPGGYWHYIVAGQSYWVPNRGFLVVLWDPGMATTIDAHHRPNTDTCRILSLITYLGKDSYYNKMRLKGVPNKVFMPFHTMIGWSESRSIDVFAMLAQSIRNKQIAFSHVKTTAPSGHVLNDTPYVLDKTGQVKRKNTPMRA